MPRPELRNHGVGWMRAVERLRNGGVPPNPVFLMPATHCMAGGSFICGWIVKVLEVLEVDILWPRWVARIGVT